MWGLRSDEVVEAGNQQRLPQKQKQKSKSKEWILSFCRMKASAMSTESVACRWSEETLGC
jgi:hypothetical protein